MHSEEIVETSLSEYEIERDKPTPSKHHAIIQGNILFLLRLQFGEKFRVLPEISLDLPVRDRVPDLVIYCPMDYGEEEIKMTEIALGVVEILSLTQSHEELEKKRKQYFCRRCPILLARFP
ncbi:MAG: Uma2 family endonuclease [Saprospiraceae bacterium]|nr:Uma2 family endonuclease [Saprospiraceae bacterium]